MNTSCFQLQIHEYDQQLVDYSFLLHDSSLQVPNTKLTLKSPPRMPRINIMLKGCEFSMDVGSQELILEIKKKIQHVLGVPADSQTLTVCGCELIDGLGLDDYPAISDGTKVYLFTSQAPAFPPPFTKLKITVKFPARKIDIEVDETDTVRSLKEKIHIVDGTPIRRMTLFFNGGEMEDDFRSLDEYRIGDRSEIIVFLKPMNRLMADPPARTVSMVVQTSSSLMNGARIPVDMNDTMRVDELKQLLLERRMLPQDDYIFIHKQRIMHEDCSLRWHGVGNGDFVYVFKGTVSRNGQL